MSRLKDSKLKPGRNRGDDKDKGKRRFKVSESVALTVKPDDISDYKNLVAKAEALGKRLSAAKVKRSQFRPVFTHLKKIRTAFSCLESATDSIPDSILKEILLLKPKTAYVAGRYENLKEFYDVVVGVVNGMRNKEDFDRFYDFVEAVWAYHRFHDGKE